MRPEHGEFERALAMLERGASPRDIAAGMGLSPRLSDELRVAASIRSFAEHVPTPNSEDAWAVLQAALSGDPEVVPMRRRRPARLPRTLVAASVAAMLVLGSVSAWASEPGALLYPVKLGMERVAVFVAPHSAGLHLYLATERLSNLESALRNGPTEDAPALATQLVAQQELARRYGAGASALSELAARISSEIPPLLLHVPAGVADEVRATLGLVAPPTPPAPPAPQRATGAGSTHQPNGGGAGGGGAGSGSTPSGSGGATSGTGGSQTGSQGGSGGGSGDQGGSTGDQGGSGSDQGSEGQDTSGGSQDGSNDQSSTADQGSSSGTSDETSVGDGSSGG